MCQCKGAVAQACYIKSERGCPAPHPRVSFIVIRGVNKIRFKSANTVRSAELSFESLAVAPFTIMEGPIMRKIELLSATGTLPVDPHFGAASGGSSEEIGKGQSLLRNPDLVVMELGTEDGCICTVLTDLMRVENESYIFITVKACVLSGQCLLPLGKDIQVTQYLKRKSILKQWKVGLYVFNVAPLNNLLFLSTSYVFVCGGKLLH